MALQRVQDGLNALTDQSIRAWFASHRVEPRPIQCKWDYDKGVTYVCWVFARYGRWAVVYCDGGFGPECPWGVIGMGGDMPSMGPDSSWFANLEALHHACFA